jgi:hypothetical protein
MRLYAVIVGNIYEATDDQRGNESMMGVPIRCYLATATQVHLKAWQQSNTSCDVHGTPLTWTKITGGIQPGLSPSGQVHGQINPLGAGRPVLIDFGYYAMRRSSGRVKPCSRSSVVRDSKRGIQLHPLQVVVLILHVGE